GINVSYTAADIGLTTGNPALLRPNIIRQLNASFNAFLAGSKGYSLTGALFSEKWQTTFGGHVHFLDYGNLQNTDAAGNVMGQFRPADFVVQASASKRYLQNWTYGLTLKFIHSAYGQFRSSALAADVGVLYQDSASRLSAAIVVKNMGAQLKTYAGEEEELPFDLQVGITKRLAKAPFGFSLTAQHLQTFDILYSDTTFNQNNNVSSSSTTFSKILTHLVLASHIYLGQTIEATVGYNFLRRQQLSSGTDGSGLTGFSAGLRVKFPKLQVLYARSAYQKGLASNQIGLTMQLDRLLGLGQ
ncbi:MAG TPA: type IX secretion system protein PorQ, partial [Flavisolibacter sp.]|nr:type IX secretion system protein PorQ [Flavisolibacter sp.]